LGCASELDNLFEFVFPNNWKKKLKHLTKKTFFGYCAQFLGNWAHAQVLGNWAQAKLRTFWGTLLTSLGVDSDYSRQNFLAGQTDQPDRWLGPAGPPDSDVKKSVFPA
jgi:hypothetical protein